MTQETAKQVLKDKRIVVTGASSGLGFAMAKALAEAGAFVLLTARSEGKLSKAVAQLKQKSGNVYGLVMDVRNEESIAAAVSWVKDKWDILDMLVNNAGIGMRTVNAAFFSEPQPFYKVSAAGFRDLIDTNLTGYFLVSKAFVPLFIAAGKGKIVNISMNLETMRRKGFVPYGPSRAATDSLSYIMTEDLKEHKIDVNILLPGGATETGMIPDEYRVPLKEKGILLNPDVMAKPIVYLASDESVGVTGQRIVAKDFDDWKSSLIR